MRASTANTAFAILCVGVLLSCAPARDPQNPYAPGIAGESNVDGLIVGHRLMAAGEYELALRAYTRAAGTNGLNADVLSAVGSANLRLGRLGQAERYLRQAIDKDDSFVPAWNNLGVILVETGELGEAAQVFKRAFALDSGKSIDIRDNLRLTLAKLDSPSYNEINEPLQLVRRGSGDYLILSTP